jgi:sugar-phosphatase
MMPDAESKSWLRRRVEKTLVKGLTGAYSTVRVDPGKFLLQLRTAYRLPISGYHGLYSLEIHELDVVADDLIRGGTKLAALEGAGFGLGGLITIFPDLGILSAITLRTIQKLSLVYGFQFNTDREIAELWMAAASAAGVDISRELLEKEVVNKFVPRVIQRIAARASAEVVEKWAGRMIPLVSSTIGAGLNYWFVRAWGERAKAHFRERHLQLRPAHLAALDATSAAGSAGLGVLAPSVVREGMTIFHCTAVLFDLDGVLVDSTRSVERQWRAWAREHGIDEEKVIAIGHGTRAVEVIRAVAPHLDTEAEVRKLESREADDHDGVVVMPGAIDLLRSIPEGRWGVVTSGTRRLAFARLQLAGIPTPKVMITADDVATGKPHPGPYLKGAELLGVDPKECVVIEDAPAGIRSAHASGMKAIGLTSSHPASALSEADAVVQKLAQIQIALVGAGKLAINIG